MTATSETRRALTDVLVDFLWRARLVWRFTCSWVTAHARVMALPLPAPTFLLEPD